VPRKRLTDEPCEDSPRVPVSWHPLATNRQVPDEVAGAMREVSRASLLGSQLPVHDARLGLPTLWCAQPRRLRNSGGRTEIKPMRCKVLMSQAEINSEDMSLTKQERQVVSRKRVADHGEVYTANREVSAMLDLVKQETTRIESRFLEPACGKGNFLAAILARKLRVVESRYGNSQLDYERNAVLAVSSIYGIDVLEDNVAECRKRLFEAFDQQYGSLFNGAATDDCRIAVKYLLECNIIWGDALTLKTLGEKAQPFVFSEWSPVNGSMLKRRDFTFNELLDHAAMRELPLFSDLGEDVFIPTPVKEYPLTHFLKIADVDRQ